MLALADGTPTTARRRTGPPCGRPAAAPGCPAPPPPPARASTRPAPPRCGPPGSRRSTFHTGSGSPYSRTIAYSRSSAIVRPSASSASTASTTCGRTSSPAWFNSPTIAAGSQCPPRTASVSSRRTASASDSSATASATARPHRRHRHCADHLGAGAARGRGRSGRSPWTAAAGCAVPALDPVSESSGGAEEKPCSASAARPVIITALYGARSTPGSSARGVGRSRSGLRRHPLGAARARPHRVQQRGVQPLLAGRRARVQHVDPRQQLLPGAVGPALGGGPARPRCRAHAAGRAESTRRWTSGEVARGGGGRAGALWFMPRSLPHARPAL